MSQSPKHARRLSALAKAITAADFEAALVTTPANLYYFCGFRTTLYPRFNGLLCTASGDSILVTSYIDEQLAKQGIWGPVSAGSVRIHGPIDRRDVYEQPLDALRDVLSDLHRLGVDDISYALFRELTGSFASLEVTDMSQALTRLRVVKDSEEQGYLGEASRIAVACLEGGREILARPGITEQDLAAEIAYQARRLGCDGFGYPILISSGEKITAPHAPPLRNAIPDNVSFVRVAFAPTFEGYSTSLIRTFSRSPSETMLRFEEAFFQALADIESMLRPGVTVQDILACVDRSYVRSGVRKFWGGDMGYSTGITVHEPPRIGGKDDTVIEAGMVLAIMPGLRQPGEATFHHSELLAVTESGCRCLSDGQRHLLRYS